MQTLDPKSLVMTYAGILIEGAMDGTFLVVEFDEDAFTKHVGAQGHVTRVLNANEGASAVITLGQGALANALLSARHLADRAGGDKHGPLLIKDLRGNTLIESDDAWIKKMARIEYAKEVTGREWTIDLGQARIFVGGLDDVGPSPF